jgi:hypothetical protein
MSCPNKHMVVQNEFEKSYPGVVTDPDKITKMKYAAFWGFPNIPSHQPPYNIINKNRDARLITPGCYAALYDTSLFNPDIPTSQCGCTDGKNYTPDPTERRNWIASLNDYPCLDKIYVDAHYYGDFIGIGDDTRMAGSPFVFSNPGYNDCVSNWNAVIKATDRFPCKKMLTRTDLYDAALKIDAVPVPDDVYQQCLKNQDANFKTPSLRDSKCPLEVRGVQQLGFRGDEQLSATPQQYCICNCKLAGLAESDCEPICNDAGGLTTATDVLDHGFVHNGSECVKATDHNGQFPTKNICDTVAKNSKIANDTANDTAPMFPMIVGVSAFIVCFIVLIIIYRYSS